ncbi:PAS domain-containing protein [Chitinophaga sp. XS-30]|nr:PAS domain-containing protein [Chitinophaga sp. XS-30]
MIRSFDWASTPAGPPEQWPQSLRTTVSIILNSRFPMFLWWGKEMIQFYNDAYRPSLGMNGKHPVAVGQRGEDCWPETWPVIKPLIKEVWEGGSIWREDQLIPIYRDGRLEDVYWTFSYSPVRDDNGEIGGVLVICHETTEKVKARQKIETAEKKFRNIVKQAPVGIAILKGPDFIVETVNDKYLKLMQVTEQQIRKEPLFEILPEIKTAVEPLLTTVLKTGKLCYGREFETKEGTFNFLYEPLRDAEGQIEGVIMVSSEVTEEVKARRKSAEAEKKYAELKAVEKNLRETELQLEKHVEERTSDLRHANYNLKRSNSDLEQFAFIASHDMQEPLRKIRTFTALLENKLDNNLVDEDSRKYLHKIGDAAGRMRKLINDMLYYSRLSAAGNTFKTIDLNTLMQNVMNDFELLIQEKNAVVRCETLPDIQANPLQITQLFTNLLSNSLKFNNSPRPEIMITVRPLSAAQVANFEGLNHQLSYQRLEFSDNGIGFDQRYAEQIFTIFQRLHTKNEYSGTGIGLALCKKIALNHQGNIFAYSGAGQGATFHVLLPETQSVL